MAHKLTPAGHYIGKCVVCGTRYYAATDTERAGMFCSCREGIACSIVNHGHGLQGGLPGIDHPVTAIKWAEVKAAKSDRICDDRCMNAKGTDCACQCDGRNHGAGWAA